MMEIGRKDGQGLTDFVIESIVMANNPRIASDFRTVRFHSRQAKRAFFPEITMR